MNKTACSGPVPRARRLGKGLVCEKRASGRGRDRRPAEIMLTDMVASTALSEAQEVGALKLHDEQAGIVRPTSATLRGREIGSRGGGFLAELDSTPRPVQYAKGSRPRLQEWIAQPGAQAAFEKSPADGSEVRNDA